MTGFNNKNFSFAKQIKQTYITGDNVTRLIFIYIILYLINLFLSPTTLIFNFMISVVSDTLTKPWKFFTYSFFFSGLFDLIFKCYLLRFGASTFKRFFDTGLFLRVYFTGIALGGIFFLSLVQLPAYSNDFYLILRGNITGILAAFSALSYHTPNHQIRILGGLSVKMLYLTIGLTLLFIINEQHLAYIFTYLFSVLIGRGYMMLYYKGIDLAKPVDKFLTAISVRLSNLIK